MIDSEPQLGEGLETAEIARLMAPAFPGAGVEAVEPLNGGRRNTNLRVTMAGREHPFVLRVHQHGPEAARKEWDIARLVYRRVPVPELIWASETEGPGGRPYSIVRFVEGVSVAEILRGGGAEDARQAAWAAGEVLARIGEHTFREPGFFGPGLAIAEPTGRHSRGVRAYIEHCLFKAGAAERLGEQMASRVWTFTMRYAHRLDRLKDAACLVHADFNVHHVLMRRVAGVWTVAAVLDWEFALAGSPLWDVGSMLRRTDPVCPAFADPFIKAFAKHGGEAPPDWRPLSRLLDLMNLMEFLARPRLPDDLLAETIAAVRATVDSLGH